MATVVDGWRWRWSRRVYQMLPQVVAVSVLRRSVASHAENPILWRFSEPAAIRTVFAFRDYAADKGPRKRTPIRTHEMRRKNP